ncbi:MAG: hypothetical protein Q7J14_00395 [Candidatus Magasanikbacteria bacterium]|nr:hypothetical protein [Candidatus Magasanikbacteria bacterium]
MKKEGRITTLSKEASDRINNSLAKGVQEIKEEYKRKASGSLRDMI